MNHDENGKSLGPNRSQNDPQTGAVSFPIYPSTAFRHPRLGQSTGFDYSRSKSPTRAVLEAAAAALESGDAGFATRSGMAALQIVFSLFSTGDHLLVPLDLYGGTYRLLEQVLSRFRRDGDLCRYERSGCAGIAPQAEYEGRAD